MAVLQVWRSGAAVQAECGASFAARTCCRAYAPSGARRCGRRRCRDWRRCRRVVGALAELAYRGSPGPAADGHRSHCGGGGQLIGSLSISGRQSKQDNTVLASELVAQTS